MARTIVVFLLLLPFAVQAAPDKHIGTGVWIWQLGKTEAGDISKIAARAEAAHLDHVLIRVTSNGDRWARFNSKKKVRALAKLLRAKGIKVYAWGYQFPQSKKLKSQIKLVQNVLADRVFDGYVYNVETEFSYRSKAAEALFAPIKVYRDKYFPGKLLGFSTYSRVDRGVGAKMPADTFSDYCDVGMPQAYWRTFNWKPKKTVYQMCLAWGAKVRSGYVLIPTGHAYDGAPGTNTVLIPAREVAEFLKASRNYYGCNLWVWERMTPEQWELLELGWAKWLEREVAREKARAKANAEAKAKVDAGAKAKAKLKPMAGPVPMPVLEKRHTPWWRLLAILAAVFVYAWLAWVKCSGHAGKTFPRLGPLPRFALACLALPMWVLGWAVRWARRSKK